MLLVVEYRPNEQTMDVMMEQFLLLAKYNRWMNQSIYKTCLAMGQDNVDKNQDSFFPSISKTLNHLLLGDLVWLYRCSGDKGVMKFVDGDGHDFKIKSLNQVVFSKLEELWEKRQGIDNDIVKYVESLNADQVNESVEYRSTDGCLHTKDLGTILTHWFNHQTHHRGQITALIHQQGYEFGTTDLILIENEF